MSSGGNDLPAIALLGPAIEHRESLHATLAAHAAALHWIPDSFTHLRQHRYSGPVPWSRRFDSIRGTRHAGYLAMLEQALSSTRVELVVAYWGTLPIGDILALKRMRPDIKVVLLALCYPLALSTPGLLRQRITLAHAAPHIDGVVCPGPEMMAYLSLHGFSAKRTPMESVRPCWPRSHFANAQTTSISPRPNLVYVGRTDLSGASVHVADDLRALILELLDSGVQVSHGQSKETDDGHALRNPFKPIPVPELTTLMSAHDASLVAYNLDACRRTERFDLTVPDRLITSVAAGVPIAIPKHGYAASKTYLRDYPAVLEFESAQDLRRQLADRDAVARRRERAWQSRLQYTAENQGPTMTKLLQAVLQR